ncbi:MAG: ATP synthase F1 subunit delta [Spirochaetia bacterium]|nr:ATP synthase F1 subunit delta [Spirochaetia bacterium]
MANLVLPSKYAEALFKAAVESNTLEAVTGELRSIKDAMDVIPRLKEVIMHPGIDRNEKKAIIKSAFGDKVTKLSLRLMLLLIDKKREGLFDEICGQFFARVDEFNGLKKITIETAMPLEDAEKDKLIKKLEAAMGAKKLVVDARVNPEILGGVIIRERMRQMDASVITFLKNLKHDLKAKKINIKTPKAEAKPSDAKKPAAKKAEVKKPAAKKLPKKGKK